MAFQPRYWFFTGKLACETPDEYFIGDLYEADWASLTPAKNPEEDFIGDIYEADWASLIPAKNPEEDFIGDQDPEFSGDDDLEEIYSEDWVNLRGGRSAYFFFGALYFYFMVISLATTAPFCYCMEEAPVKPIDISEGAEVETNVGESETESEAETASEVGEWGSELYVC